MGAPPVSPAPDTVESVPAPVAERRMPWTAIGWFAALLTVCYFPVLRHLVHQWSTDDDMGHGFFVPAIAAYIVWQERERLMSIQWKSHWFGLLILAWSAFQLMIGWLGAELFLQRTALIEAIVGVVLYLGGWQVLKALAFPLFLLVFMVPLPAVVYNQITFPLQLFASAVAEQVLQLVGIPVLREGNVLELASQKLSVVEACSGIRSLLSLTFLSLVYGYFFEKNMTLRVLLFLATIPIAIIANAARVTITGILSEINPELAQGFFHSLEGWVIFMVALTMLAIFHKVAGLFFKSRPVKEAHA
jgi:exosortase